MAKKAVKQKKSKKKSNLFPLGRVRFCIKASFKTEFLKFKKWTVSDLEQLMGYKKQQVSQTLSGDIEPTINFMHRLCTVTGLPADELIETVFVE